MYKYETHLHSHPVSICARTGVEAHIENYKKLGYDGIFLTNHYLDGNLNCDKSLSYREKLDFYFSDFDKAAELGKKAGLKVFLGVELSYGGTDFLVYGLSRDWYYNNPQIMDMKKSEELPFMMESGALVVQAHPFREASYIDHIRLFPRCVHGVEVINSCRKEAENKMAEIYADHYGLLKFAGSDNHWADKLTTLSGMEFDEPIESEEQFVQAILGGKGRIFTINDL